MRIIKAIPFLLCGLIMFTSCVKEELSSGSVAEGEPTLIKFSLSASYTNESPSPRVVITEADERKFKDIRVLIFDSQGKLVTNKKVSYQEATDNPNLTVETYSGNNRTIYVVANAVPDLDTKLTAVHTKAELLAIQTTIADGALGASGKPLLMTALKEDCNITPDVSIIPDAIKMEFMTAKVTLVVKDNTIAGHSVTMLGWGVINSANNSYVIPDAAKNDANTGKETQDEEWTTSAGLMAFDKTEDNLDATVANAGKKQATVTQYLFENRRGGRENHLPLPSDKYTGMSWEDTSDKGKAWFAPKRATAFVIHAMYKADGVSKALEAKIFIGDNEWNNYDIERGKHYIFTVTVKGINEIDIDTNLEHLNANFVVQTSAPLNEMDAHPDFRPFMISGNDGVASIEIFDMSDSTYDYKKFDATWVKVSPLNLMYHQVKQAGTDGNWQQAGAEHTFVRAKYIPHKSVRTTLEGIGIGGWNNIPDGKDDDDEMTFADATHRMCYKITDIPFAAGPVTSKTLYVYTDDYNVKDGKRSAKVKVTFQKNGSNGVDEWEFTITQNGYLTIYDEANPNAGLAVFNQDGTPSAVKKKFGVEQFEEVAMRMNLDIPIEVQMTNTMHWGFKGVLLYNKDDKYRNGYFLTANEVYNDVVRTNDNRSRDFGEAATSYRPMYGNGKSDNYDVIPPYEGATSTPYYYPDATANIYHPIYKSSAARYCHEKNRDINGDGFIDDTETHWYLPSEHELRMLWISNTIPLVAYDYWSSTERGEIRSAAIFFKYGFVNNYEKTYKGRVRCVREI